MPRCCECKTEKPASNFHRRGANGYQGMCKPCRKEHDKVRYEQNPVGHAEIRGKRKQELILWAHELKSFKPCTDCGRSYHPVAMQWDHIGDDKVVNVSDAIRRGWSKERVLSEIAKCELVCANCHSVRTYVRRSGEMVII